MRAAEVLAVVVVLLMGDIYGFSSISFVRQQHVMVHRSAKEDAANDGGASSTVAPPPAVLNGKMVLPFKIIMTGLKSYPGNVHAVYAVMNNSYKRGTDGWSACEHVGVAASSLEEVLDAHREAYGSDKVAHIRALSFTFPQKDAMEEVASQWKAQATDAGAQLGEWGIQEDEKEALRREQIAAMEATAFYYDDDDDDDDEDYYEDDLDVASQLTPPSKKAEDDESIVSPFEKEAVASGSEQMPLEFNKENVDKILDEVRPYLIADGGNVSVERVNVEKKDVYLQLEGACGSCPSSTVTMQMGIERVLKENFADLGNVLQVQDEKKEPTELTREAVQAEVNRIYPAILAMGGVVEIVSVDPIGVVEIKFHGSNKVRQGLELAIRDVPLVKHVNFVM